MEQKWPSHLVVLRHGESARNVAKDIAKAAGRHSFDLGLRDLETPLTKRGHEQARDAGRYLSCRYKFDVIYSSPYHRTRQTADDITSALRNSPIKGSGGPGANRILLLLQIGCQLHFRPGLHRDLFRPIFIA